MENRKSVFSYALLPLAWLYDLVTRVRNCFYDCEIFKTTRPTVLTISVGNLTVGGTGKTPHVSFLVEFFRNQYQTSVLSRGYGRQTRGFILAEAGATAQQIGDEPMLYHQKYGEQISVAVGEKRVEAVEKIILARADTQLVILDDAYQHRALKTHINILLTDYERLFYTDFMLPFGRLREAQTGAKRADAVVVTKCDSAVSESKKQAIQAQIAIYTKKETPVFFSTVVYQNPVSYFENTVALAENQPVVLVSAIAQPQLFERAARGTFVVQEHIVFKDHHNFSTKDLTKILKSNLPILTTEKDMVKLKPLLLAQNSQSKTFYFWPIAVQFLANQSTQSFENWVLEQAHQKDPNFSL